VYFYILSSYFYFYFFEMANIIRQLFNKGYKRSTRTRKKAHKADAKNTPQPHSHSPKNKAPLGGKEKTPPNPKTRHLAHATHGSYM
jgi:hypothetical protein